VPMLEGKVDHVIGVDTHRDRHAAAILDRSGGLVAEFEVLTDQAGYEALLGVVAEQAPGRRCWALEGTGCYGAGLASLLLDQGEWVVEVDRPKRPRGRTGAKSDPLDAIRAGREALSREHLACPRQRGQREALRVLQLARSGAVKVSADAQLLISWSHPGRLRSEAAFAMLAGVAPIPASSGQVVRYRLNRGGDRQLNRALHTIVMIREAWHEPTKRYVAWRTRSGRGVGGQRTQMESTLDSRVHVKLPCP